MFVALLLSVQGSCSASVTRESGLSGDLARSEHVQTGVSAYDWIMDFLNTVDVRRESFLALVENARNQLVLSSRVLHMDKESHISNTDSDFVCLQRNFSETTSSKARFSLARLLRSFQNLFSSSKFVLTCGTEPGDCDLGSMRLDIHRDAHGLCQAWENTIDSIPNIDAQKVLSIASTLLDCTKCSHGDGSEWGCSARLPEACTANNLPWSPKSEELPGCVEKNHLGQYECKSDNSECTLELSPFFEPCIRAFDVRRLDKKTPYSVTVFTEIDTEYVERLMWGSILVYNAGWLAAQRVVHYMLGFTVGAAMSAAWIARKMIRRISDNQLFIRGGESALILSTYIAPGATFAAAGPFWALVVRPCIRQVGHWYFCTSTDCLSTSGSEFYPSSFTKLFITVSGLIGVAVVKYFGTFKGRLDVSGHDEFGRQTEENVVPMSQKILRTCVSAAGYALLFRCTSHVGVSTLLVSLLFFRRTIASQWHSIWLSFNADTPGKYLSYGLLSPQQFDELGKVYTEQAIDDLRAFVNTPEGKRAMVKVNANNYGVLQQFRDGGDHIQISEDDVAQSTWRLRIILIGTFITLAFLTKQFVLSY